MRKIAVTAVTWLPIAALISCLRRNHDGDWRFLGVVPILPFDSTSGTLLLACYEGKDPISVTAEEAETLKKAKSAKAGGKV